MAYIVENQRIASIYIYILCMRTRVCMRTRARICIWKPPTFPESAFPEIDKGRLPSLDRGRPGFS